MKKPAMATRGLLPLALLSLMVAGPAWADHGGGGHFGGGRMGGGAGHFGRGGRQFGTFPSHAGTYAGHGWNGWNRGGGYWGNRPWYRGDWGWGGWGWGAGLGIGWAMTDPWFYDPYPWGVGYGYYAAPPATVVVNQTPVSPQGTTYVGPAGPAAPQNWFYCQSAKGYYPYVTQCPEPWRAVPATPPGAIRQ
ncbi:MAG: hypothetical protein KGI47_01830 [Betaproteobacteria bacterium]|nr:hypothetical protein [Betaproteobacteria bacterium]MDE2623136.1 hypothetical protein [Betaproteobacteria bacterium]